MRAVTQYLKQNGYNVIDDSFYNWINFWMKWYKGKVPSFHEYRQYNGKKKVHRTRKSLGMAKTVSEDWANLCLNEKVEIIIDGKKDTPVHEVLNKNNFRVRANQLVEIAFALGTGAIVEYMENDNVHMDYIRAGMIYPLRWDNGEIIDCAFASAKVNGNKKQIYLNIHEKNDKGNYVIKNQVLNWSGNSLTQSELPEGLEEEVDTKSETARFQIFKPNIVNNINFDSPMGISIFANAVDQLEGVDLVYDSYLNEFRLGKKRIIVPITMSRIMIEESGEFTPVFDDNDTEFYALEMGESNKLQEVNMEIRHEAHDAGMETALNMLSLKCGMGVNRYKFEHEAVKTATEVISDKSDLYQGLKKHELILEKALKDMVHSIANMIGESIKEVAVNFDDSIIEDSEASRNKDLQEVRDGIMTKWEYRMKWYGEDEDTAKKRAAEASGAEDDIGLFGGE